jgi:hypothetical protein
LLHPRLEVLRHQLCCQLFAPTQSVSIRDYVDGTRTHIVAAALTPINTLLSCFFCSFGPEIEGDMGSHFTM